MIRALIPALLLPIICIGCAPMPGPSLQHNVMDMTQNEVITYLDNTRGPGLAITGLEKCGILTIREQMDNNRVFIRKFGTLDTINYCTSKVYGVHSPPVVVALMLAAPILACAEVIKLYDPWYPKFYECNVFWEITYSGNKYELAHELRHVQGYDDTLY